MIGSLSHLHRLPILVGFLTLSIAAAALADDGGVDVEGGSARLMQEHPSISMSEEYVRIDMMPRTYKVNATFRFYNSGASTTVAVGFPVDGMPMGTPGKRGFLSFETSVNGKPVPTEDMPNPDFQAMEDDATSNYYSFFKVKRVFFAERSTTTSIVNYEAPYGGSSNGDIWFNYSYGTGKSWHGPIGKAVFDFRFDEGLVGLDIKFSGGATVINRSRGQLVCEMSSIEPTANAGVMTTFRRTGMCVGDPASRTEWQSAQCSFPVDHEPTDPTLMSLRLRRNAIYAKHGRVFKDASLRAIFENISWYKARQDYSDGELSEKERKSIAEFKKAEQEILESAHFELHDR